MNTTVADQLESGSQTDWMLIRHAAEGDRESAEEAWNQLARRYWPAIYTYIRRSGRDVHEAADLTQGFVCDVIIARELFAAADPKRGRFRTLLLTSVRNYLIQRHRYDSSKRRSPETELFTLQQEGESFVRSRDRESTPEHAFDVQWATTLIRRAVQQVQGDCQRLKLHKHWQVFEARVIKPMLFGDTPAEYATLVERLGLKDYSQAANMMITVKRRFARSLYEEVGKTVSSPRLIEEELLALLRALESAT